MELPVKRGAERADIGRPCTLDTAKRGRDIVAGYKLSPSTVVTLQCRSHGDRSGGNSLL
jgi:hypothetical protein